MPNRKLLLADDSITIQKVVNLTFADEGIDVIAVGDGDTAKNKLQDESPDIVLADVNMPGLNGYELCAEIKGRDFEDQVPVILLVGSFEPFDEDEADRVGADGYLTKPFQSISQLVTTVFELLGIQSSEGSEFEDTAEIFPETPKTGKDEVIDESVFSIDSSLSDPFTGLIENPPGDEVSLEAETDVPVESSAVESEQLVGTPAEEIISNSDDIRSLEPEGDEDSRIEELSDDFLKTQPFTKSDLQEISIENQNSESALEEPVQDATSFDEVAESSLSDISVSWPESSSEGSDEAGTEKPLGEVDVITATPAIEDLIESETEQLLDDNSYDSFANTFEDAEKEPLEESVEQIDGVSGEDDSDEEFEIRVDKSFADISREEFALEDVDSFEEVEDSSEASIDEPYNMDNLTSNFGLPLDSSDTGIDTFPPEFRPPVESNPVEQEEVGPVEDNESPVEEFQPEAAVEDFQTAIPESVIEEDSPAVETQTVDPVEEFQDVIHEEVVQTASPEVESFEVDLPEPEAASILDLDGVNLLELPPVEVGSKDHVAAGSNKYAIQTGGADLVQPQNDPPSDVAVMEEPEKPPIPEPFSDDDDRDIVSKSSAAAAIDVPSKAMVEAITQQVIETLSEKAIREIAWEVVPDLADLILKKMAEEKLKK